MTATDRREGGAMAEPTEKGTGGEWRGCWTVDQRMWMWWWWGWIEKGEREEGNSTTLGFTQLISLSKIMMSLCNQ
jgi:hypothetical protein